MKLSRFSHLFKKNGLFLLYNSKRNSFFHLSEEAYNYIMRIEKDVKSKDSYDEEEQKLLSQLIGKDIIVNDNDDDDEYVAALRTTNRMMRYSMHSVGLTITPTISCNLNCPYCFEGVKPAGLMSDETADKLVDFVKAQINAKFLNITWFGGEPLLCPQRIEYLLNRFDQLENIKLQEHSIVTNGTLIDDYVISIFKKYPLTGMQITLDGNRDSHNSKRFYCSGKGTFEDILDNVDKFSKECPETNISIRINVDNSNRDEYVDVVNEITERFQGRRVSCYPGILRANKGCESETFFTSHDHLEFSKTLRAHNLDSAYPAHSQKGCCATCVASHVVGPKGELYRCWEHVGKPDKVIGTIYSDEISNKRLYNAFLLSADCLEDVKCVNCCLLPICSGGCPNDRVKNLLNGESNNLCSIYKSDNESALEELLYEYYLSTDRK